MSAGNIAYQLQEASARGLLAAIPLSLGAVTVASHTVTGNQTVGGNQTVSGNQTVEGSASLEGAVETLDTLTLDDQTVSCDGTTLDAAGSTGLRIGGAATDKQAFWGATPVVQPAHANQAAVTKTSSSAAITALTYSATVVQAEAQALNAEVVKLANDVAALVTLVNQLRSDHVTTGIIKGSA